MRIGKRIFTANLSFKTSWQDLKDTFRDVGTVVYANVMRDDSGRSKGWGIVEFETPEQAVAAVNKYNGQELAGRKMLVREDREDRDVKQYNRENGIERPEGTRPPRRPRRSEGGPSAQQPAEGRPPKREGGPPERQGESSGLQIVVQGISWKAREEQLRELFGEIGEIESASVVMGRDGRSRGYGLVRFYTLQDAQAAIEKFHGTELEGRTLTVRLDKYA
ncbi:hypothetical protein WJX81_002257 [Elliptochloris bilobata]|uniref:RRM domain-containing protein n=1 Tax=Elliptochloris bilobata TaxID=381761 RepID=A0AAW1QMC2_9CHLO